MANRGTEKRLKLDSGCHSTKQGFSSQGKTFKACLFKDNKTIIHDISAEAVPLSSCIQNSI